MTAEWSFPQTTFDGPSTFPVYIQGEFAPTGAPVYTQDEVAPAGAPVYIQEKVAPAGARPIPNANNSRREFGPYATAPANSFSENYASPPSFDGFQSPPGETLIFHLDSDPHLYPAAIEESVQASMEAMRFGPGTLGDGSSLPLTTPSLSYGSSAADSIPYDTTMTRQTSAQSQIPQMTGVDPLTAPPMSYGSSTAASIPYDTTMSRQTSAQSQIPEMARVDSLTTPSLSYGSSAADSIPYDTMMSRQTSAQSQIPEMARVESTEGFFHIYLGLDGDNPEFQVGAGYGPGNPMVCGGDLSFPKLGAAMTKSPPKRKVDGWPSMNGGGGPLAERRRSGGTSANPSIEVKPQTQGYVRPKHPRVPCANCGALFRGDHEMTRHRQRAHAEVRCVWVIRDLSENGKLLGDCRACVSGKRYGVDYNATAHLRRQHFKDAPAPENIRDWLQSFWIKRNTETGVDEVVDNGEHPVTAMNGGNAVDGGSECESSDDSEDDDGPAKRFCPATRNKPAAPPTQGMQRNPSQRGRYTSNSRARRGVSEYRRSAPTPGADNFDSSPSMPVSASSSFEQYISLPQC